MVQHIDSIPNFDDFGGPANKGLEKHWPHKDKLHYELHYDYCQKANYSVQDFNDTIRDGFNSNRREVVFLLALAAWIGEATENVISCYRLDTRNGFRYSRERLLQKHSEYFSAVRSFVLAHPSSTDRHESFGFDGDIKCTDIRCSKTHVMELPDSRVRELTLDGLTETDELKDSDVFLSVYSECDGARFSQFIGFNMVDIRDTAALYMDKLQEFGRYIYRLKKRDFE